MACEAPVSIVNDTSILRTEGPNSTVETASRNGWVVGVLRTKQMHSVEVAVICGSGCEEGSVEKAST